MAVISSSRPNTPPSMPGQGPPIATGGVSHSGLKTGNNFVDFISQTDDDWDADLAEETTDDILIGKIKPPKSIEYRPTKGAGNPRSSAEGPSYPSPRRKASKGLKPQFEGLVRGKHCLSWPPASMF